jgi:N-acetylmuramoyl-L-alanine amidase
MALLAPPNVGIRRATLLRIKRTLAGCVLRALVLTTIVAVSCATPLSNAAEPPARGTFRVCIDPGHPSENNDGRELLNGVRELDINWTVAKALQKLLEQKGYVVVMTKSSLDEYVTNKRRAEIANEARADLMLRLHADSEGASGFTLYYPRKSGRTNGVEGPSAAVIEASGRAAKVFHAAVASGLRGQLQDNGIRGDEQTFIGAKQGALTGSIFSQVPTLLVEMVNLAKVDDAKWISQPANQQTFANALAAGVDAIANLKQR